MISYEKAKKEIIFLTNYVALIDNYRVESLNNLIIRQYAIHNSISKVIKSIKNDSFSINLDLTYDLLNPNYIKIVIMSKPNDELHKIIRDQYIIKTRPQRRRSYK